MYGGVLFSAPLALVVSAIMLDHGVVCMTEELSSRRRQLRAATDTSREREAGRFVRFDE